MQYIRKIFWTSALFTLTCHAALAQEGYIPQHCANNAHPPPVSFNCPVPYVEMVSDGTDNTFERVWKCLETGHALGQIGDGCAGDGEGKMFSGWSLPVASSGSNHEHEIIKYVVDPCYLAIAKKADIEGLSHKEAADLVKMMRANDVNQMVSSVQTVIEHTETLEQRMMVYTLMKNTCIKSALSAM